MSSFLEEISEVCIYLQKGNSLLERVNEVALYQPLKDKSVFDERQKALKERKSSFTKQLPFSHRALLKVQTFFFQKYPQLVKEERKSIEAKFKTVLALLLSQEALFDFFLNEPKERDNFFKTISEAALEWKFSTFLLPPSHFTPFQMARYLTTLSWQTLSLLDNTKELNLQMATLNREERDEILFSILNNIQRAPLTSVIEIAINQIQNKKIIVTTKYGKYEVSNIDPLTGKIAFAAKENETKVSIPSRKKRHQKGTVNQHIVYDTTSDPHLIGAVSGELKSKYHVLEQILFLLQINEEVFLEESTEDKVEERSILFTSLLSWNEYEKILDQHYALQELDGKVLTIGRDKKIRLSLFHQNISFNAFNKFPIPAELNASLHDVNDTGLISLSSRVFEFLKIDFPELFTLYRRREGRKKEKDFMKRQQLLLKDIDAFKALKRSMSILLENFLDQSLEDLPQRILAISLKSLLLEMIPNEKGWHQIDHLIYLSLIARYLNIIHNKNCVHATDRSAGAISIDKAQNAFIAILGKPYLPGISSSQERSLFKVFYSMYLVFEEPELNAGLCTGFVGEKFYDNFIQKNPETTHYLISWLQQHPEMYLGLSKYRY